GSSTGRMRGIQHINVDRDVERLVADTGTDAIKCSLYAVLFDELGRHDLEAELHVVFKIALAIKRTSNTSVHRRSHIDQAFLGRAPEGSAVRGRCPKVRIPGIEVSIEVEH